MSELEKVYLFTGEDSFLMEEEIRRIRISLKEDVLNFYSFNSDESGAIDQAIDLLNTVPFFDEKRVVAIRNINRLDTKLFDRIINYVDNPSDSACLILTMEGPIPWEKNKKPPWLAKLEALKDKSKMKIFNQMKDTQLVSWIMNRVKSLGNDIEADAANLLKEATLSQTWQIVSELEKLSLYVGRKKPITRQDVERLVLKNYDETLFKLFDSVFERKRDALLRISEIEAAGVKELELIAALQNQAIDHFHVLYAPSAKRRTMRPFVESKIAARRKNWKADELNSLISALAGVERGIKTGRSINPYAEITEITARYIT